MSVLTFPSELLCGYVLAGGASSRMGQDKALLMLEGQTWVEHAVRTLREVCGEVAILSGAASDMERMAVLSRFARLVPDREPLAGPAAGISAALADASKPWALVLAVDQPFLPASLLCQWFAAAQADGPAASCMRLGDHLQPVPLLMQTRLAGAVGACLRRGERKVRHVVESALREAGELELHVFHVPENPQTSAWFRNLNCPGDLIPIEEDACSSNQSAARASD